MELNEYTKNYRDIEIYGRAIRVIPRMSLTSYAPHHARDDTVRNGQSIFARFLA